MDRSSKILIGILSFFAIVMLGIYFFLSAVNKQIPKELVFPPSGFSQSIFDSQNTKYVANSAFTGKHCFQRSPYMIDIAETDKAMVSDVGVVYKISDTMYFYITEFGKDTSIESVMRNELPKAVMIDSNEEMTAIDNYIYDEGYINGFKGDYYIDCMTVTNGTRAASVYITGYALTITDVEADHGNKMFLGVVSATSDTDTYINGKQILDSVVQTYQFNGTVQAALVEEEERARKEEERLRQEAIDNGQTYVPVANTSNDSRDNLVVSSDNSTTDLASNANLAPGQVQPSDNIREDAYINPPNNAPSNANNNAGEGSGAAADVSIPVRKTKSMELTTEYTDVTLYYYYQNTGNEISVTLESPTGATYVPTSMAQGTAVFKLDSMSQGKWHIHIAGDAGTDSMKLYSSNSSEGQSSDEGTETQN